MNQQEFDAFCVELKSDFRKAIDGIRMELAQAKHNQEMESLHFQQQRDAAVREYRDEIYDIATKHSSRSAAYIAGQAAARNRRDKALAAIDAEHQRMQEKYFSRSQELAKLRSDIKHDAEMRRAEALREYSAWLEARKAAKRKEQEEDGRASAGE